MALSRRTLGARAVRRVVSATVCIACARNARLLRRIGRHMHRSRLAGFIIDCRTGDLESAASFWSDALGMPTLGREGDRYVDLDSASRDRDLHIEVQRVDHESRLHLDIESDDIEAEVARLERLGAKRLPKKHHGTWVVMEAPTGQRFCVVRARTSLVGAPGATEWP
jgi:catechol 2,3-dioxygenase-like lactoylglutathione lyase family enzyme